MPPLQIVLVDDHPIVRAGFKQLLELEPDWRVTAEVGSARDLAALMLHTTFDVLVLDLSLPDADGLVMIRHLLAQRPELAIVVLSMHGGALYVQDALAAGARGYVTKSSPPEEIISAIRAIEAGERYVVPELRGHHSQDADSDSDARLPELTAREAQILLLLARGHSVARVASAVGISPKTAYAHRANIYAKLKLSSDHDLRKLAAHRGLIDP